MPSDYRIQASRKPSSSEASIAKEPPGETNGKSWDSELFPPKKTIADWKTLVLQTLEKKRKTRLLKKRVTEFGIVKFRTHCICRFLDPLSKRFCRANYAERLEVGEVGPSFTVNVGDECPFQVYTIQNGWSKASMKTPEMVW